MLSARTLQVAPLADPDLRESQKPRQFELAVLAAMLGRLQASPFDWPVEFCHCMAGACLRSNSHARSPMHDMQMQQVLPGQAAKAGSTTAGIAQNHSAPRPYQHCPQAQGILVTAGASSSSSPSSSSSRPLSWARVSHHIHNITDSGNVGDARHFIRHVLLKMNGLQTIFAPEVSFP